MRTTVTLDKEPLDEEQRLTGLEPRTAVIQETLRAGTALLWALDRRLPAAARELGFSYESKPLRRK